MFLTFNHAYYVITGKSQIFYFYSAKALIFMELPPVHEIKCLCTLLESACQVNKPSA